VMTTQLSRGHSF